MWQPSPEGECRDAPQFWCDFGRNSGQFSGFLKLKHALQMSRMMSIDMVHQLHHHDWAKNTLKTSNRTCNDLTSCLYVPCFSVANMLTLQTYFSTSLRMLCSVIQSLRFLMTSLRKHQKWENLSWKPTPFCSLKPALSWVRFCCNFTKKLPNRIGEVKSIYLKTSLPATWTASKVQKCQPTWSNIGKTEGMLLNTWEMNSFLWRNEKYWETLAFIWYLLWTWENLLLRYNSCFDGMICTLYAICSSHSRRSAVSHLEH